MSDYSMLVGVGRNVRVTEGIHVGDVGLVVGDLLDKWEVDLGHTVVLKDTEQLEPMFTMDQVIDMKFEEQNTPALVKAVTPFGMSSDELAHDAAHFIAECVARIKGVGNDQYNQGGHQKFETMELDELFQYAEEEVQDIANYAVFLGIRLSRLRMALDERDDLGRGTEEEYAAGDITADYFKEEDSG